MVYTQVGYSFHHHTAPHPHFGAFSLRLSCTMHLRPVLCLSLAAFLAGASGVAQTVNSGQLEFQPQSQAQPQTQKTAGIAPAPLLRTWELNQENFGYKTLDP